MTDFRRTLLWMIFLTSLVFLWDAWQRHSGKPSLFFPAAKTQTAPLPTNAKDTALPAPAASIPAGVPAPSTAAAQSAALPTASANTTATPAAAAPAKREQVTINTDVLRATIDSIGGDLVRVELLKHADIDDKKRNVVLLDNSNPVQRVYVARSGLVNAASGGELLPNHTTPMTIVPGARELGADGTVQVKLESAPQGGVKRNITYTFRRGSYLVDVKHEVLNLGAQPVQPQVYLQLVRDGNKAPGESSFYQTFTGPAVYSEAKKFEKIDFSDVEKGKAAHVAQSPDGWVAMVQHYFASAWIAPQSMPREFRSSKVDTNLYAIAMVLPLKALQPADAATVDTQLFVGPQEEKALEKIAPGLELVKDYGWFTVFAKPLFWLLEKIYGMLGNWGWAIVALTFLVKLAFYPLQAAAYKSMAKMKAVTPRMTEIRERYKDEPQRMNQAMMELYRTEKLNPFGGCLPILIQIPIFIALYWVLLSSVEMRGAPWILWINDLSKLDPFYALPILMTATMFLQIKLNPTPPDPLQARLMWMMPAIFSIMFFFFPAGLVLYWLTNNILSIAQQWWINKKLGVS
jgi:YidC/Oxa1 family membrane protein insertase